MREEGKGEKREGGYLCAEACGVLARLEAIIMCSTSIST